MAFSTVLDVTQPTSWAVASPRVNRHSGLWAGGHHGWEAAGYLLTALIAVALVPAMFVILDHAVVSRWSNEILDLVNLR